MQDNNEDDLEAIPKDRQPPEGMPQSADTTTKTGHVSAKPEHSEEAASAAGENCCHLRVIHC